MENKKMKGGEMMEKGQLWVVVGVALVVALIASVLTVSVTGNAVSIFSKPKPQQDSSSQYYTKGEIDSKFFEIGPLILRQFNNQIIKHPDNFNNTLVSCDEVCGGNYTCINALVNYVRQIKQGSSYWDSYTQVVFVRCDEKVRVGSVNRGEEIQSYDLSCACR